MLQPFSIVFLPLLPDMGADTVHAEQQEGQGYDVMQAAVRTSSTELFSWERLRYIKSPYAVLPSCKRKIDGK